MKLLHLLITLPLAVVLISLSVANRQDVVLDLAPLPLIWQMPVYGLILGCIGFGLCLGFLVSWLAGRPKRRAAARDRKIRARYEAEAEATEANRLTATGSASLTGPSS